MKEEDRSKEVVRPLRSGSKIQQTMKIPGPPPAKVPKVPNKLEDLSILKKSIDTSVTGPMEIMKILQGGTSEVIDLLKNECYVIYECKVCRNLFRSLANFITHKRNFCTAKFTLTQQSGSDGDALEHSLLVGGVRGTVSSSRKTTRRDILSLLDNLQERLPDAKNSGLVFSEIPQTLTAVYNSSHFNSTSMIQNKEDINDSIVVVGPSGHIVGSTQDNGLSMDCKSCGESISQIESHVDSCTAIFKQCFGCPICQRFFTTSWAVYRHLKKVHGKNSEQVRKLRNSITKQELPVEKKLKRQYAVSPDINSTATEKGWLDELQKNGVDGPYECYLCKKQFERRVALLTHTKECEKRKPGPGSVNNEQDKKSSQQSISSQSPSPDPALEKPSLASIQVRVCYKKDLANKLNNCRVVATRLSDKETIAALLPDKEENNANNKPDATLHLDSPVFLEDNQHNSNIVHNDISLVQDKSLVNHKLETHSLDCPLFKDPPQDIGSDDEIIGIDKTQLASVENITANDNSSQDIFASQPMNCNNDIDETSSVENNKLNNTVKNGFILSSSACSNDPNLSQVCSSLDNPCNGWESPNKNIDKNNFFSSFINKQDTGDNTSDSQSPIELDYIDSVDVTRIICGSVKPVRGLSTDEDMSQDKPTPSVSTDVSMDFDNNSEHDEDSDSNDQFNEFYLSLDPYISKTDSICMLCYEPISDMRYGYRHVAYHLGITRYACCAPNCTAQAFARSDLIDHIKTTHRLDCTASLIRALDTEDMFTDQVPNFNGFDIPSDIEAIHNEFYCSLLKNQGIPISP